MICDGLITLDCCSPSSAIDSLARLLRIGPDEVTDRLKRCDVDQRKYRYVAPENRVLFELGFEDVGSLPLPDRVLWFHATRVKPGTDYEEGILPTSAAAGPIWDFLTELIGDEIDSAEWERFRAEYPFVKARGATQFTHKLVAPNWEGPFAFLVREAAMDREAGHRDFTGKAPEYVEDICSTVEELFGLPLEPKYLAATEPCLVVFSTPSQSYDPVRAALNYAHAKVCERQQTHWTNSVYVGNNQPIPREWIVRIERLVSRDELI